MSARNIFHGSSTDRPTLAGAPPAIWQVQRGRLGYKEPASGSAAGLIDRVAMDFNVVMSMGDTGVVEWCRKDAEAASAEYEKALMENLPPEIRSLMERQLGEIRTTVGGLEGVLREYGGPKS
jgi:hypothetical protein